MTITIEQINAMNREEFTRLLGAVFEHSPWVASAAWESRPFGSADDLHAAMMNVVRESRVETIVDLFRAHPDLGTRLAVAEYSAREQRGAGLNQLTSEEYERFYQMNRTYVKTFGFPFILAVRGKKKEQILSAMEARMKHTANEEAAQALLEIEKISGSRLRDLITESRGDGMH
ncbi:2-oxo-4-hydroxy-4-carboxy-5-ureidoimidazoline decarboxylase [Paenibacillus alkaliterrae]|uniref:2-oxo-4-hydroxy-4-carboxy-5-ureidoimidazoline decarboxylase n=1 Tax=Paenibacillus alkaliterrae TaxID=320909 RepID=UPI001F34AF0C|nr:2-oxo-4-hydroxy-4-carboxy-5-ureidoimidazoline decarboxylase [Paenibacillus alkaliterrae]MCF2937141.1 2-oxo-4-hydroxy-4-carboxy-5-ureidoimidazoline decarboxylase [Paenibacillus alkaliterrae]